MQNLNSLYRCKQLRLNLIREYSTPRPSLIRTAVIIRVFSYAKISLIRFDVHNIFSRGRERRAGVSHGNERAETCPLIKPLEVLFSPPYEGDNDRSYIPAAMKNGRECRLVRLEAVPRGFARVGSNPLSSRGAIYEKGVRNLPEPENVSSSAYQRTV